MLLRAAPEGAAVQVQIRRFFGDVSVVLSMPGSAFDPYLGEPGVPGAGFVCLGIVLSTIHVPIEALGLIIAINPIMDMCETVTNTTGDMAAALIAAKSEKLLDESVYRK